MTNKSAKSIAWCISIIAQDAAKLAGIDHEQRIASRKSGQSYGNESLAIARCQLLRDMRKHEDRLARALQEATWRNE